MCGRAPVPPHEMSAGEAILENEGMDGRFNGWMDGVSGRTFARRLSSNHA